MRRNRDRSTEESHLSVFPCRVDCAVGHGNLSSHHCHSLSTLVDPISHPTRPHLRSQQRNSCSSDVLKFLLFPISSNCTILILAYIFSLILGHCTHPMLSHRLPTLPCILCPPALLHLLYLSSLWTYLISRRIQLLPSHLLNSGLPYVLTCRSSDLASPSILLFYSLNLSSWPRLSGT